jgi:hypothetical protein
MKAIFLHIYYKHLWGEIKDKLKKIPFPFNLYVNLVAGHSDSLDIVKDFPNARINVSPNQGMDVGGQLRTLNYWLNNGCGEEFLIFIHSKGNAETFPDKVKEQETSNLRNLLMSIISPDKTPLIEQAFADSSVGMVGVEEWSLNPQTRHGNPIHFCDYYCDILKLNNFQNNSFGFIGGTMFWVRSEIYRKVFSGIDIIKIVEELEPYSNGGKIHALERIFGYIVLSENFKIKGV